MIDIESILGEEAQAAHFKKVMDALENAYPHLVKLHQLQPKEKEWLNQLVMVTSYLGKTDETLLYNQKLRDLGY